MFTYITVLVSAAMASWGPFPAGGEQYDTAKEDYGYEGCSTARLESGIKMPPGPGLYRIWHPESAWGTPRMIGTLLRAAEEVAWLVPHADPLVIGDISKKGGGPLDGHSSHRGGADADIGIYFGDAKQYEHGFMLMSTRNFDPRTNWLLVRSLLESEEVERILLDQKLVNILRTYVIREGELSVKEAHRIFPSKVTTDVWARTGVVHHHPGHMHHFHVRVLCN
jgi:murein endopeptidase